MKRSFVAVVVVLTFAASSLATAQSWTGSDPLRILGFTDITFSSVDGIGVDGIDSSSGFKMGQLVLHFVRPLSDHWSVFAETATTANFGGGFSTSVERAIARYAYSDQIKISAGRYHTPVNYWNEAFHHGQWLQTTARRPEMTMFGGKFVPVHFVGVLEEGNAGVGSVELSWIVGVGNGRQSNIAGAGEGGDVDTHRAWLASFDIRPDALYELEVGVSFYGDAVPLDGAEDVDELLTAAHAVWHDESPEIIAEYTRIVHEGTASNEDGDSSAWYAQIAWRLPLAQDRLKPYIRYEQIDIDDEDPVFGSRTAFTKHEEATTLLDQDILTLGMRIDVSTLVALKTEFRRQRIEDGEWFESYVAQLALSF